ncbi:hypothetical protein [Streptomyces sp. HUCO-GS316]|uniref:hypothetical protein n=1 Tax=Streptomyces sp. HUCO-GS316 TaxID=2692198 RepID=UPI0019288448|nr:hypothetical protein [Streptomyces sp. HUCO-GS316]
MDVLRRMLLSVLLALAYLLLVIPVGLVAQLLGDPLERRPDPGARTYWTYLRA